VRNGWINRYIDIDRQILQMYREAQGNKQGNRVKIIKDKENCRQALLINSVVHVSSTDI
jgi:hypothetical protein